MGAAQQWRQKGWTSVGNVHVMDTELCGKIQTILDNIGFRVLAGHCSRHPKGASILIWCCGVPDKSYRNVCQIWYNGR